MSETLSRRALLAGTAAAGLTLAVPATASAATTAVAAFRLVRAAAGEPATPEITLPEGYSILAGTRYSVASRLEYYTFVTGPANPAGIEVQVTWPGVLVESVVYLESRLPVRRDRREWDRFTFTLPITRATANDNQPTLQIWSYVERTAGLEFNLQHNDPDRVAGPWTGVAWPEKEVRSQVHQLFAASAVLRASGLQAAAAAKGHRWFVQGFETNNTLHADNPPHWHITYNSGPGFNSPTHNTHFWLDADARNFYNGMDVTGLGRLRHYVGDPAAIYDFQGGANGGRGELVATMTIREDGGIDIAPPSGPVYAIAAGERGSLVREVTVLRDERPWLRIETKDEVRLGRTTVRTTGLQDPAETSSRVLAYDPLTGSLR
ncbi:hypothetical protein [Desertihabitans aurantiacus]|uniref:hypothetical protein n=1 Tax=Desertihabitans aurantiacus TaxID=2282477 RepID=UPI000DF82CD6|nr:hypothetical protein [Desertihabitans aurantiacus]